MSERERAVLDFLLAADIEAGEDLRRQAETALAIDGCTCGCPSVNFDHPETQPGLGIVVNARIRDSNDGMFLFMEGPYLGGIEYVPIDDPMPNELPDTSRIELMP